MHDTVFATMKKSCGDSQRIIRIEVADQQSVIRQPESKIALMIHF